MHVQIAVITAFAFIRNGVEAEGADKCWHGVSDRLQVSQRNLNGRALLQSHRHNDRRLAIGRANLNFSHTNASHRAHGDDIAGNSSWTNIPSTPAYGPPQAAVHCSDNWGAEHGAHTKAASLAACKEKCDHSLTCKAISFSAPEENSCVLCRTLTVSSNDNWATYIKLEATTRVPATLSATTTVQAPVFTDAPLSTSEALLTTPLPDTRTPAPMPSSSTTSAVAPNYHGFCCKELPGMTDVCGTCNVTATAELGDECGFSSEQCASCGGMWCSDPVHNKTEVVSAFGSVEYNQSLSKDFVAIKVDGSGESQLRRIISRPNWHKMLRCTGPTQDTCEECGSADWVGIACWAYTGKFQKVHVPTGSKWRRFVSIAHITSMSPTLDVQYMLEPQIYFGTLRMYIDGKEIRSDSSDSSFRISGEQAFDPPTLPLELPYARRNSESGLITLQVDLTHAGAHEFAIEFTVQNAWWNNVALVEQDGSQDLMAQAGVSLLRFWVPNDFAVCQDTKVCLGVLHSRNGANFMRLRSKNMLQYACLARDWDDVDIEKMRGVEFGDLATSTSESDTFACWTWRRCLRTEGEREEQLLNLLEAAGVVNTAPSTSALESTTSSRSLTTTSRSIMVATTPTIILTTTPHSLTTASAMTSLTTTSIARGQTTLSRQAVAAVSFPPTTVEVNATGTRPTPFSVSLLPATIATAARLSQQNRTTQSTLLSAAEHELSAMAFARTTTHKLVGTTTFVENMVSHHHLTVMEPEVMVPPPRHESNFSSPVMVMPGDNQSWPDDDSNSSNVATSDVAANTSLAPLKVRAFRRRRVYGVPTLPPTVSTTPPTPTTLMMGAWSGEASEQCIHPPTADPESWLCDCYEEMKSRCQELQELEISKFTTAECVRAHLCRERRVCDGWKNQFCHSQIMEDLEWYLTEFILIQERSRAAKMSAFQSRRGNTAGDHPPSLDLSLDGKRCDSHRDPYEFSMI